MSVPEKSVRVHDVLCCTLFVIIQYPVGSIVVVDVVVKALGRRELLVLQVQFPVMNIDLEKSGFGAAGAGVLSIMGALAASTTAPLRMIANTRAVQMERNREFIRSS